MGSMDPLSLSLGFPWVPLPRWDVPGPFSRVPLFGLNMEIYCAGHPWPMDRDNNKSTKTGAEWTGGQSGGQPLDPQPLDPQPLAFQAGEWSPKPKIGRAGASRPPASDASDAC